MISDSSINKIQVLSFKESVYYSAFTFFRMEYDNLRPKGLLTIFTIIEVFIAEILLITFIGVMASVLIDRINLRDS